jgi:alkanesulfonate monooxygenase SsuD/methylene tetrahydromethanopterin reductase-like flavin-dependent oxidoreductase (luciferase family)
MTEVRFDFPIVPADLSFEAIRQLAQEAETLGYEMISIGDHLVREQPLFEQWTTLAFIASCTDTINIGSLITNPAFRSPVLLAKLGATVDHISDGRLVFGIAAGGNQEREYTATGFEYLEPPDRIDRMAEAVRLVTALWSEDNVSFDGTYVTTTDLSLAPKPVQDSHPPIWIGQDTSARTLDIVAETADAVDMHAESPTHANRKMGRIAQTCDELGRDSDEIAPVLKHFVILEPTEEEVAARYRDEAEQDDVTPTEYVRELKADHPDVIIGTPDECRDRYRNFIDAGYTHFTPIVLPNYGDEALHSMRLFADEVMTPLREH